MAEPYAGGDSDGAESTTVYSTRIVEDRTVHDTANGSSDAVTTAHFAVSVTQDPEHVKPKEYVCSRLPSNFLSCPGGLSPESSVRSQGRRVTLSKSLELHPATQASAVIQVVNRLLFFPLSNDGTCGDCSGGIKTALPFMPAVQSLPFCCRLWVQTSSSLANSNSERLAPEVQVF